MNTKIVWTLVAIVMFSMLSATSGGKTVLGQDKNDSDGWKQAKVSYAQAVLEVAQADLAKAREANTRAPETIPSSVVRGLENDVAMAQGRVCPRCKAPRRRCGKSVYGSRERRFVFRARKPATGTKRQLPSARRDQQSGT